MLDHSLPPLPMPNQPVSSYCGTMGTLSKAPGRALCRRGNDSDCRAGWQEREKKITLHGPDVGIDRCKDGNTGVVR